MSRIIILTQEYPFGKGEVFLATELDFYAQHNQEVILVPLKTGGSQRPVPAGVSVYAGSRVSWFSILTSLVACGWLWKELFKYVRYLRFKSSRTFFLFFLKVAATQQKRLLDLKASGRITPGDVLYSYWLGGLTAGAVLFNAQSDQTYRLISRAHGGDVYANRYVPAYLPFREFILAHTDYIAVASQDGQRYLQYHYPAFASKIHCHYLGTSGSGFTCKPSDDGVLRIVSCAYAKPVKRLHLIVEALAVIQKEYPETSVAWTHLGGGPMLEEIKALTEALIPSAITYFSGDVSQEDILAFYRDQPVDVFVNVSSSEGLPVSIMEAMSAGIPVLATDVGGVKELVDDSCGKLLRADVTASELAGALLMFRAPQNPDLRARAASRWRNSFQQEENYRLFLQTVIFR